jgi:hypothetical protein
MLVDVVPGAPAAVSLRQPRASAARKDARGARSGSVR